MLIKREDALRAHETEVLQKIRDVEQQVWMKVKVSITIIIVLCIYLLIITNNL